MESKTQMTDWSAKYNSISYVCITYTASLT